MDLDFDLFRQLLRDGNINKTKVLVTQENSQSFERYKDDIIWYVCSNIPDNPELLHHFVSLGCSIAPCDSDGEYSSPLHIASEKDKPRLVRALLELGYRIDTKDRYGDTPLHYSLRKANQKTTRLLMDAGAHVPDNCSNNPLVKDFQTTRQCARSSAVAVLCLKRCSSRVIGASNGNDVLRMIARCVWATRGH